MRVRWQHVWNGLALGVALLASAAAVLGPHGAAPSAGSGHATTVAPRRIVSLSLVSDAVLDACAESGTVVAVSAYGHERLARRWHGLPRLPGLDDLEAIIALRPDLVIVQTGGVASDRVARLEAAGLRVACLGEAAGLAGYLREARRIGRLIGQEQRADAHAHALARRMERVAPADGPHPRAMYLASHGDAFFGGAEGTSFHDVLRAAGARDVAAEAGLHGWPQLSVEQILQLHPEIIVCARDSGEKLKNTPVFSTFHPRFIEIDGALLNDPGPGMLDAAEALADALGRR